MIRAYRLAQVDRPRPGAAPARGQPGGQCPGQRGHHPAHLTQLIAGGPQELDILGQLRDSVHLDVLAAELLGGATFGLSLHHPA